MAGRSPAALSSVDYRLSPGLNSSAISTPKTTAAAIPPAVAVQTAGKNAQPALFGNSLGNALCQRVTEACQGTVAPAPPQSAMGWYSPTALSATPATT